MDAIQTIRLRRKNLELLRIVAAKRSTKTGGKPSISQVINDMIERQPSRLWAECGLTSDSNE